LNKRGKPKIRREGGGGVGKKEDRGCNKGMLTRSKKRWKEVEGSKEGHIRTE